MVRIFLSSEGQYRKFSHKLVAAIEANGFNIWNGFNQDIELTRDYWSRVAYQIETADIVLAVLSSTLDDHVISEIERAKENASILLVAPIKINERNQKLLQNSYGDLFDLHDWSDDQSHPEFQRLLERLVSIESDRAIFETLTFKRQDTLAFLASVRQIAREKHDEHQSQKPNGEKELAAWQADDQLALSIIRSLDTIAGAVPASDEPITEKKVSTISKGLTEIKRLLKEWYSNNSADVVDGVIRIGLVGLVTGVGLIFGQPLIFAAVGAGVLGTDKLAKGIGSAMRGGTGGTG